MKNLWKQFRMSCYDPAAAPVVPAAAPVAAPAAGSAPDSGTAGIVTPPASVSTTMTMPKPGGDAPVAPAFALPEAFKDKPYLKGVDSQEKLLQMLDGAQALIGKRPAGIPAPDAPQAEWDKFYEAAGRPAEAKAYTFDGADKADPKFTDAVRVAMHKAGLNPNQAKTVYSEVNTALQGIMKERGIAEEKNNADFEALASKTFGADKDKILASSKALLDKHAPAEFKPLIAGLPNEQLVALAGALNNIAKTYIREDGAPGSGPSNLGSSPDEIRAEARALMADPAYSDPFNPKHEQVTLKVKSLYDSLKK